jgi:glycosyltransferase involved in cell wall biosynthesis
MKIFIDYRIFEIQKNGGISTYFSNLAKEFIKLNFKVKIFSGINISSCLKNYNIQKNVNGFYINNYPKFSKKFFTSINFITNFFVSNIYKPNIYHQTYYGMFPSINKNIKKIITIHDLIYEKYPDNYDYQQSLKKKRESLKNAEEIICVSESTKNELLKYYELDEKKISVIYHGYDHLNNEINHIKSNNNNFILYVGSRGRHKNFKNFIAAYCINKHTFNKVKIICIGGGNFSLDEKKEFSKYKINTNYIINIQGNDNMLKILYANAKFLIYPSTDEGFGIPVLEAMSLKCPVLISDIPSLKEIAGEAGIYFNPYDIESISEKIDFYFNCSNISSYVKSGLINLKRFSWEKCAKETIKVYLR